MTVWFKRLFPLSVGLLYPTERLGSMTDTSLDIWDIRNLYGSTQILHFTSVAQSCPTFCESMDCGTPDFPVHHQLPEIIQTHVHCVGKAIQPTHLLSPSPSTFNISQYQGFFKWVSFSHQVTKILEYQLQHQSFQWIFRTDFHYDGLVGSPCSPRDSVESSPTAKFQSINSLALSFLYSPTLISIHDYWKNHNFD